MTPEHVNSLFDVAAHMKRHDEGVAVVRGSLNAWAALAGSMGVPQPTDFKGCVYVHGWRIYCSTGAGSLAALHHPNMVALTVGSRDEHTDQAITNLLTGTNHGYFHLDE